jgi:hypothetical protein
MYVSKTRETKLEWNTVTTESITHNGNWGNYQVILTFHKQLVDTTNELGYVQLNLHTYIVYEI